MSAILWGTFAPEQLESNRRVRNFGLSAAVRAYNEAAAPGLGGLWFAKSLMLALLGLRVAAETGRPAILVTNAIEALACLCDLHRAAPNNQDPRVRGRRKLASRGPHLSFDTVAKRSFYVTQPTRIGMTQPLMALGFAEGVGGSSRFGALRVTDEGRDLLTTTFAGFRPSNRSLEGHLTRWVEGEFANSYTSALADALSMCSTLPEAALSSLDTRLRSGAGGRRRGSGMDWLDDVARTGIGPTDWTDRPQAVDTDHWNDLQSGALFFTLQGAAQNSLNRVEEVMAETGRASWTVKEAVKHQDVAIALQRLRQDAEHFKDFAHRPAGTDEAEVFANRLSADAGEVELRWLVAKDGRILALAEDTVRRGTAFDTSARLKTASDGSAENDDDSAAAGERLPLPANISHRIRNLALLNMDLRRRLDSWLGGGDGE